MTDCINDILNSVEEALASKTPLSIVGGGSKSGMVGRNTDTDKTRTLNIGAHSGIVDYQPSELVLSARAGTPLTDIKAAVASEGQMLSFEPPDFGGRATLGGTLACNLSGPARPWNGSIRDLVLGVQLINGKAELLNFGGQVMKNVAGYDVSRLQAGALGTLGVLTRVNLKVLPAPEYSVTLCYEMDIASALTVMNARAGQAKPLNAACWVDGSLFLRLSGTENAVVQTAKDWGGEEVATSAAFWQQLCEMNHPFFSGDEPLWRLSHRPNEDAQQKFGPMLIDWGGAQRWVRGNHDRTALEKSAADAGGHMSLFRGGNRSDDVKHSVTALERRLHQRLKHAFDPAGILNPGQLYSWM